MSKIKSSLVQLSDYAGNYKIKNKNQLIFTKDQDPMILETTSMINLSQKILDNNSLVNTFTLVDVNGKANNQVFATALEKGLILSKIQDKIKVERDRNGKIGTVLNMDEILMKWGSWKENKLYEFLPILGEQEDFVESYEIGLQYFEENLKYELQYIALYPECYNFTNYKYSQKDYTSLYILNSRLLQDLEIHYKFYPKRVKVFEDYVVLDMESQIINNIFDHPEMEKVIQDPINNYKFTINLNYIIDKNSGELICSELHLFEHINKYFNYKVDLQITNNNRGIPNIDESIQKVYNSKFYTDEQWEEFERHSQKLKTENKDKGGRFFLGERKYE